MARSFISVLPSPFGATPLIKHGVVRSMMIDVELTDGVLEVTPLEPPRLIYMAIVPAISGART